MNLRMTVSLSRRFFRGLPPDSRTNRPRQKETETAYYVTALSRDQPDAKLLLKFAQRTWGVIENGWHYIRDEVLAESRCTFLRGYPRQNWAALRNAALNWLRREGVTRNSLRLFPKFGYVEEAMALTCYNA